MAFDLSYLDQRVVDRCGVATTDTRLTQAVRFRAINDALEQISLERDWPWLLTSETITTVANTATSALPTNYLRTDSIVNTTLGTALRRTNLIDIDTLSYTGIPVLYHSSGLTITLAPTPDAVYSLKHRFHRTEPALTTGASTPLIPQVYGRGVVEYAAMLLLKQVREADMAAIAERDYMAWLKRASDNSNASREPLRIRCRPGAWF